MINGYDASYWSGDINFSKAKASGNEFAFYRVGRGHADSSTTPQGVDKNWLRNRQGSINAGIVTGGYWRFFTDVPVSTQVNIFVTNLGWRPGMLPPLVDIEDAGNLGKTGLTDWALNVLSMVHRAAGIRPILYTGKSFYDNNLEGWRLVDYQLGIAWQKSGSWGDYGSIFWQYQLDTPSSWSTGNIDLQKFAYDTLKYHTFENELIYFIDNDGMFHGPQVYNNKLLPESGSSGTQSNLIGIVHTMVGYLNGTDSYFRRSDIGTESHLGIGGKYDGPALDGAIYQWMKTWEGADANLEGRPYSFSVENSDGGHYTELWSPRQFETNCQVFAAWCIKYGRPPTLVARANRSNAGLAYHRQGINPWRLSVDDKWSVSDGKICPGFERSADFINRAIPRIRTIVKSALQAPPVEPPTTPPVEPDMQLDDIVGRSSDGKLYTVRDVFQKAYLRNDEAILSAIGKVSANISYLENQAYAISEQPTWESLDTWDSLGVWAKL